jgi:hypothetical protein
MCGGAEVGSGGGAAAAEWQWRRCGGPCGAAMLKKWYDADHAFSLAAFDDSAGGGSSEHEHFTDVESPPPPSAPDFCT